MCCSLSATVTDVTDVGNRLGEGWPDIDGSDSSEIMKLTRRDAFDGTVVSTLQH